jgi:hypothetical protein
LNSSTDGLTSEPHGEKHESDRGIYTITMQKSGNKNTPPIKLKRSTFTTTTTVNVDYFSFFHNPISFRTMIKRPANV